MTIGGGIQGIGGEQQTTNRAAPWSVVIAGRWNRAIFTPQYVGRSLLRIDPEAPLAIEFPLNTVGPFRARHNGLIVTPDDSRLVVELERPEPALLADAREVASRALELLPHTPVFASGWNVFYDAAEKQIDVAALQRLPWDETIAGQGLTVVESGAWRTVDWNGGRLLTALVLDAQRNGIIHINFERRSEVSSELLNWLRYDQADIDAAIGGAVEALRGTRNDAGDSN